MVASVSGCVFGEGGEDFNMGTLVRSPFRSLGKKERQRGRERRRT